MNQVNYYISLQARPGKGINMGSIDGTNIDTNKHDHQPIDKAGSRYKHMVRSITANRNKDILSAIAAKRALDINPMPSERAFRGMAGLAVLYPSVVDWMYRS